MNKFEPVRRGIAGSLYGMELGSCTVRVEVVGERLYTEVGQGTTDTTENLYLPQLCWRAVELMECG